MKKYPIISEKEFLLKEVHVSYKKKKLYPVKINCSESVADFLGRIWDKNLIGIIEQFVIVCLDRANNIVGYRVVSSGGIFQASVDIRLILSIALNTLATSIILAHNHPSGEVEPSEKDFMVTYNIQDAARYLDIEVVDHIIITENRYLSFADSGYLKKYKKSKI
ncbi:MAG: JAB domain-containing protein [Bacteroidales bacterium]